MRSVLNVPRGALLHTIRISDAADDTENAKLNPIIDVILHDFRGWWLNSGLKLPQLSCHTPIVACLCGK